MSGGRGAGPATPAQPHAQRESQDTLLGALADRYCDTLLGALADRYCDTLLRRVGWPPAAGRYCASPAVP